MSHFFDSLVFTPDDVAAGAKIEAPLVLFDFDNYTMGGALAEMLADRPGAVTYVTPAGHASAWTILSNELPLVHQALARRHAHSAGLSHRDVE